MPQDSGPVLRRSLLFTPGLRPERFAKALSGPADMVCIDLEDGVAPDFKVEARDKAIPALFNAALGILRDTSPKEGLNLKQFVEDLSAICIKLISDKSELDDLSRWKEFCIGLLSGKKKTFLERPVRVRERC